MRFKFLNALGIAAASPQGNHALPSAQYTPAPGEGRTGLAL